MGLFSGAFGAGLSQGLGEGIAKGINERRKMQTKYVDNMMDTAKAYAPKYQAAAAEIDSSLVQMNNLKRDFNISEAEYVALAQAHPNLDAIYKDIYVQKDALTAQGFGNKINRDTILKTLNLGEKGIELPEGMTAKEALRTIHLGIANNLSKDPTNKSEGFSNKSVSDAFASMFMMNPNSSAKQIVNNMQVAGVEVDDILAYERSGGVRGTVYDSVNASPFALPNIDYKADDMQRTRDRFTREATKKFALTDDITNLENAGAFNARTGGKDTAESIAITNEIGLNFAKLEKQLFSQSALFNSTINRTPMMYELLKYIQTPEDIKTFNNAVKNNTMASILIESFEKNQGLNDEYAKKIFDTDDEEEVLPPEYTGSDYGDGNVIMPVEASTVTDTGKGDGLVSTILSNTKGAKSSVELKDLDLKNATFNTEENAWFDDTSGKEILEPTSVFANSSTRKLKDSTATDQVVSMVGGNIAEMYFDDTPLKDLNLKDATFDEEQNAWFDDETGNKIVKPRSVFANSKVRRLDDSGTDKTNSDLSLWEKIKKTLSKKDAKELEKKISRIDEEAQLSPAYKTDIERILDSDMSVADKAAAISKIARKALNTPGLTVSDSYKELKGI
jgi:hypothetical protein